jgi:hypothetical protein
MYLCGESLELTLKSAYARKAKRQPSMCFYTATTHRSEHGAEERSLGSFVSEPAAVGQIARQLIQCGRLGQFRPASRLLYSG